MNRQDGDRGTGKRLTERTRKLITETEPYEKERQTELMICPVLYAVAIGQITIITRIMFIMLLS